MTFPFKKSTITTQRGELPFLVLIPLVLTILIGGVGWYGQMSMERTLKEHVTHEVQNTLKAAHAGLHLWRDQASHEIESWADLPKVRSAITALARRTAVNEVTVQSLLQSKELQQLRTLLKPFTQKRDHVGFVAFDPSGLQIAALLDEPVGKHNLSQQSNFVKKALAGETVISFPFLSTMALPKLTGIMERNQPTMFAAAPVRDETGMIIGALGFRLRPHLGFSEMLQAFQNGETGETYAFNADGLMISESRFLSHLIQGGRLPTSTTTSILNIHIQDPEANLANGSRTKNPPKESSLTLMAASAITGQAGLNLEGYRDYRGVSVIGAWMWLEQHGFGIASEMDTSEAYASLEKVRIIFFGIIGLLTFGSIISGGIFLEERRVSAERHRSEKLLRRYEQIVAGSDDFLAFIDTEYKYCAINTPYLQAFSKTREEIIGHTGEALLGAEIFETQFKPPQTQCLNGKIVAYEKWINFPGRGRRCIDCHYTPFKETDGSVTGIIVAVRDITNHKKMETQLQYAQFAMDQTADAIYWIAQNAHILYANKAACTKLGYTQDELQALSVFDINPGFPKENWPAFWEDIRNRHSLLFESQHCTKEGRAFPIEIGVTHLEYEGQSYNCAVVRDITERKENEKHLRESETRFRELNTELEERVNERTEELQFANKELEAFSYSVSHDLRAPLRAINGFGKALLDDYGHQLPAEGQRYLTMIRDQAQTMGTLIDDLLTFSRLSRKSMHVANIDMTMLFRDVVQKVKTEQDLDRILQINIGSIPPAHGDRSLLTHAVGNLVANALKFTSGKSTTVIDVSSRIEGSEVVYSIKDNGVGFDMDYVDKLFGVFQRLHSQEEFEGTGVGLALVQRIITRHGGRVWAEAKVNEGATFYFTLPRSE